VAARKSRLAGAFCAKYWLKVVSRDHPQDVTFNHIFVSDMSNYGAMNEVYREYFPANPPARYCIRADLVKPEFLVEIASIAHVER
jgi:enamine deaminase RidA (YjgF/YER057c/UK114 family)